MLVGAYLRVGAFSSERLSNDSSNSVNAYSNRTLIRANAYWKTYVIEFKDGFR